MACIISKTYARGEVLVLRGTLPSTELACAAGKEHGTHEVSAVWTINPIGRRDASERRGDGPIPTRQFVKALRLRNLDVAAQTTVERQSAGDVPSILNNGRQRPAGTVYGLH